MKADPEAAPATPGIEAEPVEAAPAVRIDELVPTPLPARGEAPVAAVGMRTARVTSVTGRRATIALRGRGEPVPAAIAPEVDPRVIADALETGDAVLVEIVPGEEPVVVAALHTRRPRAIKLKAATIEIEGEEEVLLRSGKGAIRVRADGDIEVIGSRISAASRGLFRIVGRMLRLN